MNSEQAKEILSLYRPGTADSDDHDFSEALGQVKRDPDLGRWFEHHCTLFERTRAKFRQINVPDGLKEQILSERKVRTTRVFRRNVILAVATFAAAVALGVLIGTIRLHPGEDLTFTGFRNRMARTVTRGSYPRMDLETGNLSQIHEFLARHDRGDYSLPQKLEASQATGCALLSWQNNPVTMICFNSGRNNDPKTPDLFLFIVSHDRVPGAPESQLPAVSELNDLTLATWNQGNKTYMLGTLEGKKLLQEVL